MDTLFQTLAVFVISLSVLMFFGPIIVIISIIGNVQLGPVQINLTHRGATTRSLIAIVGLGSWLLLYIPLVLFAFRTPVPEPLIQTSLPILSNPTSPQIPTSMPTLIATSSPLL